VDYLFRSVAHTCGSNSLGVIMTGMGSDGTLGCRLLKRKGATILTQDEASCVVYGMPKAPADEGLSDVIAPLDKIAAEITRLAGKGVLACR
jgi:two-component system, chemotaxis family, protein-glutamate methylesterase/glutaminase